MEDRKNARWSIIYIYLLIYWAKGPSRLRGQTGRATGIREPALWPWHSCSRPGREF